MNAHVGVTILTERTVDLVRQGRHGWIVSIPPKAPAFVVVPVGTPDRRALSGRAIDALLQAAQAEDRREFVAGGWLVHAHGPAWDRPRLVRGLRALLLAGPGSVIAAQATAQPGLLARLRAALAG